MRGRNVGRMDEADRMFAPVVGAQRGRAPGKYVLLAELRDRSGVGSVKYQYSQPRVDALSSLPADTQAAYVSFHRWIDRQCDGAPSAPSNAVIIWNHAGRPMVDLDNGTARSEVNPYDTPPGAGWAVDPNGAAGARRSRCKKCGKRRAPRK